MPREITCPSCGTTLSVSSRHAGRKAKCGLCQERFIIQFPPVAVAEAGSTPAELTSCWPFWKKPLALLRESPFAVQLMIAMLVTGLSAGGLWWLVQERETSFAPVFAEPLDSPTLVVANPAHESSPIPEAQPAVQASTPATDTPPDDGGEEEQQLTAANPEQFPPEAEPAVDQKATGESTFAQRQKIIGDNLYPKNEFYAAARLASQSHAVLGTQIPPASVEFYRRLKKSWNRELSQCAEYAWQARIAEEAASRARALASQKKFFGIADLIVAGADFDLASDLRRGDPEVSESIVDSEQRRELAGLLDARGSQDFQSGLKSYLEANKDKLQAERFALDAHRKRRAAWETVHRLAPKYAGKEQPGEPVLRFAIPAHEIRPEDPLANFGRGGIGGTPPKYVLIQNVSGRDLTNVTLETSVTVQWAYEVNGKRGPTRNSNLYFLPHWPAGHSIQFWLERHWDRELLRATFDATWSLYAEELSQTNRRHRFDDNVRQYVYLELEQARETLKAGGKHKNPEDLIRRLRTAVRPGSLSERRINEFEAEISHGSSEHDRLHQLLKEGREFTGHWRNGTRSAPVGLKLVSVWDRPHRPAPIYGGKEAMAARVIIKARLYDPAHPDLYKVLTGESGILQDLDIWGVEFKFSKNTFDEQQHGLKLPQLDTEPTFQNLLRVRDKRGYRMTLTQEGSLKLFSESGDEILFSVGQDT